MLSIFQLSREFETILESYQFCRKSENDAYNRGCGVHVTCIIMTHCMRKIDR